MNADVDARRRGLREARAEILRGRLAGGPPGRAAAAALAVIEAELARLEHGGVVRLGSAGLEDLLAGQFDARRDVAWVTPRVATGAGPQTRADVRALRAAGVTHVVDCRAEVDATPIYAGSGLALCRAPTGDDGAPKGEAWFGPGVRFALAALRDRPDARILSQCAAGINRGPSMCFALLLALGARPADARRAILRVRPQARLAYAADAERWAAAATRR